MGSTQALASSWQTTEDNYGLHSRTSSIWRVHSYFCDGGSIIQNGPLSDSEEHAPSAVETAWGSCKYHLSSRCLIYLTILEGPMRGLEDSIVLVFCIPPTNQWANRKDQPDTRTVYSMFHTIRPGEGENWLSSQANKSTENIKLERLSKNLHLSLWDYSQWKGNVMRYCINYP